MSRATGPLSLSCAHVGRGFLFLALLSLLCAGASCGLFGEEEQVSISRMMPRYRSGVEVLYEVGPLHDPGSLSTGRLGLGLFDVAHDGETIFVVLRTGRSGIPVFHSDPGCVGGCNTSTGIAGGFWTEPLMVSRDAG